MWYIYTTRKGKHYPLEVGYKAVKSRDLAHDYDKVTGYCRSGCGSWGSGGCPPWAPHFQEIRLRYPYGVPVFARFFCRFQPATSGQWYSSYWFQDIVLSSFFTRLGYALQIRFESDLMFLNSGHCAGCGDQKCSFSQGMDWCRNPQQRTYSIGATGVEVTAMIQDVFGIDLQWCHGEAFHPVEYITKASGIFCKTRALQDVIMNEMVDTLNSLSCCQCKIGSQEYRHVLKTFL